MRSSRGFTLVELLLVLALLGIIAGIAIPRLSGAKDYARRVGDARANAMALRMALEGASYNTGYPAAGSYTWGADGTKPSITPPLNFDLRNASKMNITLEVAAGRQAYTITAVDAASNKQMARINHLGADVP